MSAAFFGACPAAPGPECRNLTGMGASITFAGAMPRSRSLLLASVVLRLALGALLTLVIAWAAAAFSRFPDTHDVIVQRGYSKRDWLLVARQSRPGVVRYLSTLMIRAQQYTESPQTETVPGWVGLPDPPPASASGFTDHYEISDGYGWPLPALGFHFHGRGRGNTTTGDVVGGIELSPRATGGWYDPRALPLTPIWPGLAVDLAVATALMILVLDGFRTIRTTFRRRRGRCASCGYDLRGLAHSRCPECGQAPAQRPVSPAIPASPARAPDTR